MFSGQSDTVLIKQYLEGNEKVLTLLIERYLKAVYNIAYRYVGNQMDAEDLTQEIFVKVWQILKKFDFRHNFCNLLFTIAKNHCYDWLRKKKVRSVHQSSLEECNTLVEMVQDMSPLPSEVEDQKKVVSVISEALDQLAVPYRLVLDLYYQEQFTFSQVGEMLHEPVNTIKSRHRRGIIQLRRILKQRGLSQP